MINLKDAAGHHFRLGLGDYVAPCPFCGNATLNADEHEDDGGIELQNTHTASYWMYCPCGVEVSGSSERGSSEAAHKKSASAALWKWNERVAS